MEKFNKKEKVLVSIIVVLSIAFIITTIFQSAFLHDYYSSWQRSQTNIVEWRNELNQRGIKW